MPRKPCYDDIGGLHPVVEHTRMYGYSLNHRTGEIFCNLQRGGVVVHQCDACPGGGSCLGGGDHVVAHADDQHLTGIDAGDSGKKNSLAAAEI